MNKKWPVLSYENGKASYDTLHMFTQILGKIKIETLPWMNHSWHVTLKTTPTGLTTGTLPFKDQSFQIELDLTNHKLLLTTSRGEASSFELQGLAVAEFYRKLFELLGSLDIHVKIYPKPVELVTAIPFAEDTAHNTYEVEHITALHKTLLATEEVLTAFRCEFKGKTSPVHFFWGSFDMAVSLFSGRKAPEHPGGIPNLADWVAKEAYSHEVMSGGFWPGSEALPEAAFYCYFYPEPKGFRDAIIQPAGAYFHDTLGEFILPYKTVQQSDNPATTLKSFLNSAYESGTALADWDREALEE